MSNSISFNKLIKVTIVCEKIKGEKEFVMNFTNSCASVNDVMRICGTKLNKNKENTNWWNRWKHSIYMALNICSWFFNIEEERIREHFYDNEKSFIFATQLGYTIMQLASHNVNILYE